MWVLPNCDYEGLELMSVSINKVWQKQNTNINQLSETLLKERELELDWLSGFSEAESMFYKSTTVYHLE